LILVQGPKTFYPRKEHYVIGIQKALEITPLKVVKLKATKNLKDDEGISRIAGEEWLYRKSGSYLPSSAYISFVKDVAATIVGDFKALHLSARAEFTDFYGIKRKAGDEWLITKERSSIHFVDAYENYVREIEMTIVQDREFCIINNPIEKLQDGTVVQRFGGRKLVNGPLSFFLQPNECLEPGHPHPIYVLKEDEALLLYAENEFSDTKGVVHYPGEKWLINGPGEYVPPIDVKILEKRAAIPLHKNEGIYIRDEKTGEIRAQIGSTYLLKAHESLWEKELPENYELLLQKERLGVSYSTPRVVGKEVIYDEVYNNEPRDKTKVISYKIAQGKCVQVYNYKTKENKIVFGPELILLQPDEILTLLSLSGGKPKRENCIQSLSLLLGPEIISDLVEVETSDHAKIELDLSYKWHFEYNREHPEDEQNKKLFSVADFVGDLSKSVSSRIRGTVSSISYEDFHHNSAEIIRGAVFGREADGTIKTQRKLHANNLFITSCDIKSQRPIEKDIEEKLKKNTFLAIQIKTKATEMEYTHQTLFLQQESKGELDIKRLEDDTLAEMARIGLYRISTEKDAMFSIFTALADAKAENEKLQILGKNKVDLALLEKEEQENIIQTANTLALQEHEIESNYERSINTIEIEEQQQASQIEVDKLRRMITVLGAKTLSTIVNAGPDMQAKMLKSLGLKGYLMTDGKSPINLFDTANGLVTQANNQSNSMMGGLF
jgi:major vault protein